MSDKLNVLWMAVDDLRPQLGCYGHSQMHTPNLDRLSSSSVTFERHICQQPICMASRASFMTGQIPERHRIYTCRPLTELCPDVLTLNGHFAANGYQLLGANKIYHWHEDNVAQFQDGYTYAQGQVFGRGYTNSESHDLIAQNDKDRLAKGSDSADGRGPCTEAGRGEDSDYPDGAAAAWAVEQLQHLAQAQADGSTTSPFFMGVGWYKPHLPFAVPKRYWDMYKPEDIEYAQADQLPEGVPEYSRYGFGELRNYADVPDDGPLSDELKTRLIHAYYACVSFLDAQVGKVLDMLEQTGLAENTIVVFVADHGYQLGEHGLWCKHTCFWPSYHVPLMIRVPGMTKGGSRVSGLSESIDLFPTLCELANLQIPQGLDGDSMAPWLKEPATGGKSVAYTQWPIGPERIFTGYTVVTDSHRYTQWIHRETGEVLAAELYDHKRDPHETVNCSTDPSYQSVREDLATLLDQHFSDARLASSSNSVQSV